MANQFDNNVSIVDLTTGKETKRIAVPRERVRRFTLLVGLGLALVFVFCIFGGAILAALGAGASSGGGY